MHKGVGSAGRKRKLDIVRCDCSSTYTVKETKNDKLQAWLRSERAVNLKKILLFTKIIIFQYSIKENAHFKK